MTSVAVVDHGAGNLVSMMRALETVGAEPTLVQAGSLSGFDRVILPGVGAAGPAMRTLNRTGMSNELRRFNGPLLGVCVGMQLLFDRSLEDDTECLGLIGGTVTVLDATPLPHIGWNSVTNETPSVFGALGPDPLFYFVHSYAVRPADANVIVGSTSYGSDTFASAVKSGSVTGLQFHPERSGGAGLSVLTEFLSEESQARHVA